MGGYVRTYTAAHIRNTETSLRRIISLTLRSTYPRATSSGYPLNRRLNGSNDRCGRLGARKKLTLITVSNRATIPLSNRSYTRDYNYYAIPAPLTMHKREVIYVYGLLLLVEHSTGNSVFLQQAIFIVLALLECYAE